MELLSIILQWRITKLKNTYFVVFDLKTRVLNYLYSIPVV